MIIDDVKSRIIEIARNIGAPEHLLPLVGQDTLEGWYIDIEGKQAITYRLIIKERGKIVDFTIAPTLDDLMYAVFKSVTHDMSSMWAAKNRKEGEDHRRTMFAKQLELLDSISHAYAEKRKVEIDDILKISPYHDK